MNSLDPDNLIEHVSRVPPFVQVSLSYDALLVQWDIVGAGDVVLWYTVVASEGLRKLPYFACLSLDAREGRRAARRWWMRNGARYQALARNLLRENGGQPR